MARQAPLNAGARSFIVRALHALIDTEKEKLVEFARTHMKIPGFTTTTAPGWVNLYDTEDEQVLGWLKAELSRVAVPALALISRLQSGEQLVKDAPPDEKQILDSFTEDEVLAFAKVYLR